MAFVKIDVGIVFIVGVHCMAAHSCYKQFNVLLGGL
jgi:hypothetical protein